MVHGRGGRTTAHLFKRRHGELERGVGVQRFAYRMSGFVSAASRRHSEVDSFQRRAFLQSRRLEGSRWKMDVRAGRLLQGQGWRHEFWTRFLRGDDVLRVQLWNRGQPDHSGYYRIELDEHVGRLLRSGRRHGRTEIQWNVQPAFENRIGAGRQWRISSDANTNRRV